MPTSHHKLRAWITPAGKGFQASVISANAIKETRPATQVYLSQAEAQAWIEGLASSTGYEIEWLDPPPRN